MIGNSKYLTKISIDRTEQNISVEVKSDCILKLDNYIKEIIQKTKHYSLKNSIKPFQIIDSKQSLTFY
jgi:hypothetical protein